MPFVDPADNLVESSFWSGTSYKTGAGRIEWGEGVDVKITKEAKKQANAKKSRITEKRKKNKGDSNNNNNNEAFEDSDSD